MVNATTSTLATMGSNELLRFTNCQALLPDGSLPSDISTYSLHVDPVSGKIVDGQEAFFDGKSAFTQSIDLDGDFLVPGFIDVQINGGYGVDFSDFDDSSASSDDASAAADYLARFDTFAQRILETGVTSFVPTIITQKAESYRKVSPPLPIGGNVESQRTDFLLAGYRCIRSFRCLHRGPDQARRLLWGITAKDRSCRRTKRAPTARRSSERPKMASRR
jgi:N-acetylglucosamine-6-phosphate deacetylase